MRIHDYLEQPASTDQDNFITRLDDSSERVRRSLRDFVVGEKFLPRLDAMLAAVGARLTDNRDVGRFIYGSFGSGKSHLLTVLGKMLEHDNTVYDIGHPALRRLRATHAWLDRHKTLVVRLNMMGKRGLTSALYEAFNGALPPGAERLEFTDEERIFKLVEGDARRVGGLDARHHRRAHFAPGAQHSHSHGLTLASDPRPQEFCSSPLTWPVPAVDLQASALTWGAPKDQLVVGGGGWKGVYHFHWARSPGGPW